MADCIVLNDGTSLITLNDGTSCILLNGEPPGGVQISGTHATIDLRGIGDQRRKPKVFKSEIDMVAQVIKTSSIDTVGLVLRNILLKFESKIIKPFETMVKAKILITEKLGMKARHIRESEIKTLGKLPLDMYEKYMIDKLREMKLKKIKKLYDTYKELEDDG